MIILLIFYVASYLSLLAINGCESSPCLEGQNCIDTDAGHLCVGCMPGYRKGVADQCVRKLTFDLCL